MRQTITILIAACALWIAGCDRTKTHVNSSSIQEVIRTTTPAVDALARHIVKDLVPIELLCPADQDAPTWHPSPETIALYQRARLIIMNGAGYESWAQTAPLPRSRIVNASEKLEDQFIVLKGKTHSHGPKGDHTHDVILGTLWLDPLYAISQAETITDALIRTFPEYKEEFTKNLVSLTKEINELHDKLNEIDFSVVEILAESIPYGYISKRYSWRSGVLGNNAQSWSMDLFSLKLSSADFDSKPVIILCDKLLPPEVSSELLESHNAHILLWKVHPHSSQDTFVNVFSENILRLEETVHELTP
ncbi:MAG: metal ABC transporter substrate-binding protein [Phycisphaerales bacterium]